MALRLKFGSVDLNAGMGIDSVRASTLNDGGRTRNVNTFANVSYNFAPSASVGWEIDRIETDYKAGACERVWRTQAIGTYGF